MSLKKSLKMKANKVIRRTNKAISSIPVLGGILQKGSELIGGPTPEAETKAWRAYKAEHKANKESRVMEKSKKIEAKHTKLREERTEQRKKDKKGL